MQQIANHTIIHYGPPNEKEKLRALQFMALSPTERFNALMQLIAISYEVKMAKQSTTK